MASLRRSRLCKRSGETHCELLLHLTRLRAQHRLAETAELAGQGGVNRVRDFRFIAGLAQRCPRGRGHASDHAERRAFDLGLDLVGRLGAGELDRHLEAEFHVRDLGLEYCGIAVGPDLRKVAYTINARSKKSGIAQLL